MSSDGRGSNIKNNIKEINIEHKELKNEAKF